MVRVMVQLTEEQAARLKERAEDQRVSVSALVREGVNVILERSISRSEARMRAKSLIGAFPGPGDASERHDEYFAEASGQ